MNIYLDFVKEIKKNRIWRWSTRKISTKIVELWQGMPTIQTSLMKSTRILMTMVAFCHLFSIEPHFRSVAGPSMADKLFDRRKDLLQKGRLPGWRLQRLLIVTFYYQVFLQGVSLPLPGTSLCSTEQMIVCHVIGLFSWRPSSVHIT